VNRGYALPLVLLLALVAGMTVAAMLGRQSAQALMVNRLIERYHAHHAERGVRELADGWIKSITAQTLAEAVDTEPRHALHVRLDDDRTLDLYISQAQHTALSRFDGLPARDAADARRILRAARRLGVTLETRQAGPVAIAVADASRDTLRAVALSVLDDEDRADSLADALIRERERRPVTQGSVASVANTLGIESDARAGLVRLLTSSPVLFAVRAEIHAPEGDAAYEGLATLSGAAGSAGSPVSRDSSFLSWRKADQDDNSE